MQLVLGQTVQQHQRFPVALLVEPVHGLRVRNLRHQDALRPLFQIGLGLFFPAVHFEGLYTEYAIAFGHGPGLSFQGGDGLCVHSLTIILLPGFPRLGPGRSEGKNGQSGR